MTRSLSFLELKPRSVRLKDGRKVVLRPPRKEDAGRLLDHFNELIEEDVHFQVNRKVGYDEEVKWLGDNLEKIMKGNLILIFVEADGKTVGSCRVERETGKSSHVAEFGIAVSKEFRRQGLGEVIGKETIKLARRFLGPKPKILELWVFEKNKPAFNLYKKLGFRKEAVLKKRLLHRGKYQDKVFMSRTI